MEKEKKPRKGDKSKVKKASVPVRKVVKKNLSVKEFSVDEKDEGGETGKVLKKVLAQDADFGFGEVSSASGGEKKKRVKSEAKKEKDRLKRKKKRQKLALEKKAAQKKADLENRMEKEGEVRKSGLLEERTDDGVKFTDFSLSSAVSEGEAVNDFDSSKVEKAGLDVVEMDKGKVEGFISDEQKEVVVTPQYVMNYQMDNADNQDSYQQIVVPVENSVFGGVGGRGQDEENGSGYL